MTLKNFKLQILFSGFLTLVSITVSGQYLRKNMISAEVNGGFLQQKTDLGFHYSIFKFNSSSSMKKHQLFFGLGGGTTDFQSKGLSLFRPAFIMQAYGAHFGFMLTHIINSTKKTKKDKNIYNTISIKYNINRFYRVNSYFNNYDNGGSFSDIDSVYNPKCLSSDLELNLNHLIQVNPNNFFYFGIYFGLRNGQTSGIRYNQGKFDPNSKGFSMPLKPLIFGFNFGYQVNFGKQNTK